MYSYVFTFSSIVAVDAPVDIVAVDAPVNIVRLLFSFLTYIVVLNTISNIKQVINSLYVWTYRF